MKKNHLFWVALVVTTFSFGQTIFINEIHYANNGVDVNEGIEIAGPAGTNLLNYKIVLYNGADSMVYDTGGTINLTGVIPNQLNNLGTLWFAKTPIQNGSPDGIALINPSGVVIQFLSYDGIITAGDGPAIGLTSVDIGIIEDSSTPISYSLQLIGNGSDYSDFTWNGPILNTIGAPNTGQTLPVDENNIKKFNLFPNPVANRELYINSTNNSTKQIEIYSLNGKLVYKKNIVFNEVIKLTNLIAGLYLIKIKEEGKIETHKLIIK